MAGGGLNIAFAGFWLIVKYTSCEWDDKIAKALGPLVVFLYFCFIMWGTVLVFGKKLPNRIN